ncbi:MULTISPECIES: TetR/AcrR family transcriptional regulator [unclassified Rhizobium]|uniref:TetR/AcrR family transcriptional regulator n=1 Tax=unclassified Rhizobium TaxID=2613769 RepID=UPI00177C495B|nr:MULTISPECIES: TetR/AcrR family transcriptional regulator [unclassified Rhizobium]MBD8687621.1 TetR/AcrR family transcriptional regulator [Rhizobium sp. CFBP 13644]MBD8692075.1 TetR/AcrR family transcriptional regulator [Rhizobium sp. CFBP 13717]
MARTGRPRNFDRDEAVKNAMHLFWQHGYEGASTDQLRLAMGGISSASFYAAFGSKEMLFRESLQRYLDQHGGVVSALRDTSLHARERLEQALLASVDVQTEASHPSGCMITLSATILSKDGVTLQALTAGHREETRRAISDCITDGVSTGALKTATDISALVSLYDAILLGVSIQARDGVSIPSIRGAVRAAMASWDAVASDSDRLCATATGK